MKEVLKILLEPLMGVFVYHLLVRTLTAPPPCPGSAAALPGAGVLTTALRDDHHATSHPSSRNIHLVSRYQSGGQPVQNKFIILKMIGGENDPKQVK